MSARPLLILSTISCLSGCFFSPSIGFQAQTIVAPNGSVQRTYTYRTDVFDAESTPRSPLDELKSDYLLPPGGEWTEHSRTEEERDDEIRVRSGYQYRKTTHFGRGQVPITDFRRHGFSRENIASNAMQIETSRFGFWSSYRYEETFRDVVTAARFVNAANEYFTFSTEYVGGLIEQLPDSQFRNAGATIRKEYGPAIQRSIEFFVSVCIGQEATVANCEDEMENYEPFERFMEIFDDEDEVVRRTAVLFPAPDSFSAEEWLEVLGEKLEEADCDDCIDWPIHLGDDVFGVHGFLLFKSYRFEISLTMPGDMISNNADSRDGKTLTWEFLNRDFQYRAHSLIAKSRMIYWNRIVAAFLILLICALWLRARAGQVASGASS